MAEKTTKKHTVTKNYKYNVYSTTSLYAGDVELLATVEASFKEVVSAGVVTISANKAAEEYARNIGLFGLSIENPNDNWNYYPPHRIYKIEYFEINEN